MTVVNDLVEILDDTQIVIAEYVPVESVEISDNMGPEGPPGSGGGGDVSGKVDKVTDPNRIYATGNDAAQTSYPSDIFTKAVNHSATAGVARPVSSTFVCWKGSVFPSNAALGDLYLNPTTNNIHLKTDSDWKLVSLITPGAAGTIIVSTGTSWEAAEIPGTVWGGISGDLEDQTDLTDALNDLDLTVSVALGAASAAGSAASSAQSAADAAQDAAEGAQDTANAVSAKLLLEGTTGHVVTVAGADGSLADSGVPVEDLLTRVTALAAEDTGAGLRFDLTYPSFGGGAPNTFERWVNSVLYAGANEWGAFRSWRAPFADAAVRVIIPQGQTAWDTTPAIHLNDRRTGAPTPNLYARTWTGKLIRNGALVNEVYRWNQGDADPTAGGTIPLPPNVTYVLHLGTGDAVPSWAPANSTVIRGLATLLSIKGNPNTDLDSDTETIGSYSVVNDGTATDPWPNRLDLWYKHGGAKADRLVQCWNEYLEWRGMPAKNSTVGWRIFAAPDSTEYASRNDTTMVAEVSNWRDGAGRATMWGVTKTGQQTVSGGWRAGSVVTLNADQDESDLAAAPPPPGTLIVRRLP